MVFGLLTLLTDYGPGTGFVGSLHAVAYAIAPKVRVIDLDHSVPAGDVRLGALKLERLMACTPPGVHVAIVDPGVGTSRLPVGIAVSGRIFIGPDNGILCWAATSCGDIEAVVTLDDESYFRPGRASTFDGRDIFVPVAAHIATGVGLHELGSVIDPSELVTLERPKVLLGPNGPSATLEVTEVDSFGNVQLSGDATTARQLGLVPGSPVTVTAKTSQPTRFGSSFSDVEAGQLVLLIDSDGALAISANRARADALVGIKAWAKVRIEPA